MQNIIKRELKKELDDDRARLEEHNRIKEVLKPLSGKIINKQTLNKKRLAGYELINNYGMYHIKGKFDHLIGYDTDPYINIEKYEKHDSPNFSGAMERIQKNENANIPEMAKVFSRIQKALSDMQTAFGDVERNSFGSYDNPIYYAILKAIEQQAGIDEYHKFTLSDLYFIRK